MFPSRRAPSRWRFCGAVLVAVALLPFMARATVSLPRLISDGVVFQREQPIHLWGQADPGETVQVILAGHAAETTAGRDGRWSAELAALPAGGPYALEVRGTNVLRVSGVYLGELWVASGQSNMEWLLHETDGAVEELARPANDGIRVFKVRRALADARVDDVVGEWLGASPGTTGGFTAVGYHFARFIQAELGVPVGIIDSSWGGTPAAAWIPAKDLQADVRLNGFLERFAAATRDFPSAQLNYERKLAAWQATVGPQPTRQQTLDRPLPPLGPGHPATPAGLFNGMVAPLTPMRIRGVIWYQGEADATRAATYRVLFPTLITSWRREWQLPAMPFLYVQLANYGSRRDTPEGSPWAELREAQRETLRLPQTGMAVAIDIGDPNDIHPRNKREVGRRLSLVACAQVYGKPVESSGPLPAEVTREPGALRVRFVHATGGLQTRAGAPITGFLLAGEDRRFAAAEARIEGETVVLRATAVPAPVAVRYAWSDNPTAPLVNGLGLPASPFRSDDWPGVTEPKTATAAGR